MENTQNNIQEYVCGFLFFKSCEGYNFNAIDEDLKILLILKNKPQFQKDRYNGIGGKIEQNETPREAMIREFKEEANLYIDKWECFALMEGPNYKVHFYKSFISKISIWESLTEESVDAFLVENLPDNLLGSVKYLIPLALENDMRFAKIRTE